MKLIKMAVAVSHTSLVLKAIEYFNDYKAFVDLDTIKKSIEGIKASPYAREFYYVGGVLDDLNHLNKHGLIERVDDYVRLTKEGDNLAKQSFIPLKSVKKKFYKTLNIIRNATQ